MMEASVFLLDKKWLLTYRTNAGVAELADAEGLSPSSSECGFETHRPHHGSVAECIIAPVLKTGVGESSPWVGIPPDPPYASLAQMVERLPCK